MAKVKLMLTNFSGRELSRSGYSGTGNWTPPPPSFMSNGLTYGPIYLFTGTLFHVEVGYKLSQDLGCRTSLSCISKWFGGFCSRLLRLRTGKLSSAFRLHGFTDIF